MCTLLSVLMPLEEHVGPCVQAKVHMSLHVHAHHIMYMMSMSIWSLYTSRAAVLHNPRDFHLHCSLSEWLCIVQQQGAASHSD